MTGSAAPPGGGGAGRVHSIELDTSRRRRVARDVLRLTPQGATIEVDALLREPLRLLLGQLQIGLIERGADRGRQIGRFPVLRRLSATAVIPREQGIEGWLWTSTGGSALTVLGEEDEVPNGALLFTKPLGPETLEPALRPEALAALAARSPLGVPTIPGVLFHAADAARAENAFRAYGLLRPLTDREVPPTMRRALPTDKPADPAAVRSEGPRGSVAPPGF